MLRGKSLGYGFRRQRPIGKYIADFMCIPLKLILEVDGITHTYEEAVERDINRQKMTRELFYPHLLKVVKKRQFEMHAKLIIDE